MDPAVSDMEIHSSQSSTPDDFGKVFDACHISTLGLGEKTAEFEVSTGYTMSSRTDLSTERDHKIKTKQQERLQDQVAR